MKSTFHQGGSFLENLKSEKVRVIAEENESVGDRRLDEIKKRIQKEKEEEVALISIPHSGYEAGTLPSEVEFQALDLILSLCLNLTFTLTLILMGGLHAS